ncbi:MAG: 2OG-Fe(II) oxygenase family protein [Acidihalobacter sp.]
MSRTIPVFDLRALEGDARMAMVRDIRRAAEEVGFFCVTHTGVHPAAVDGAFAAARRFFDLPRRRKEAWRYRSTELNHGWVAAGQEALDPSSPADLKESFTMRNVAHTIARTELWPDAPFRDAACALYRDAQSLSQRLLIALAEGLELPANWFLPAHTGENQTLRLLHYPYQEAPVAEGQLGAGAHTDYGSITLLWQDDAGGLEVMGHDGAWLAVEPRPEAVIVNIGDLMQRWTNDVLRSTLHRVQPRADDSDRYSIAFFCDPDDDVEISVAPTCIAPGEVARYPAIRAGDHISAKLAATY